VLCCKHTRLLFEFRFILRKGRLRAYRTFITLSLRACCDLVLQRSEASQDEDIKKFARQVETAIPVLKRGVLGVREKLDDALVAAADSPAPRVVKYLRECSSRMDELKKQVRGRRA